MPTTAPSRPGLTTLTALLGLVALLLVLGRQWLGPTVPYLSVTLCWAASVVGFAGLRRSRPPRTSGWWDVAVALGVGAVTDTLLIVVGHPADYDHPLALSGYLLVYGFGLRGLYRLMRGWARTSQIAAWTDAAILASAVLSVLLSFSYGKFFDTSLPLTAKAGGVFFAALDAILIGALARVWLAGEEWSSAIRLCTLAPLFLVAQDVVSLVLLMDGAQTVPELDQIWLIGFILFAAAMTRPGLTRQEPDPRLTRRHSRRQAVAVGLSLAVPYLTVLGFHQFGRDLPWLPVSAGGLLMSALAVFRMDGLLGSAHDQTRRFEELTEVDPLTLVANRRGWEKALSDVAGQPQTSGSTRWVAMLDLDHFKSFNDRFGHQAGDALLEECARAWSAELGPDDLLSRYGGEEFAVLASAASVTEARRLAERLRAATPQGQTCSIGLAWWVPGEPAERVLRSADQALYAAKTAGRNRVVMGRLGSVDAGSGA